MFCDNRNQFKLEKQGFIKACGALPPVLVACNQFQQDDCKVEILVSF